MRSQCGWRRVPVVGKSVKTADSLRGNRIQYTIRSYTSPNQVGLDFEFYPEWVEDTEWIFSLFNSCLISKRNPLYPHSVIQLLNVSSLAFLRMITISCKSNNFLSTSSVIIISWGPSMETSKWFPLSIIFSSSWQNTKGVKFQISSFLFSARHIIKLEYVITTV